MHSAQRTHKRSRPSWPLRAPTPPPSCSKQIHRRAPRVSRVKWAVLPRCTGAPAPAARRGAAGRSSYAQLESGNARLWALPDGPHATGRPNKQRACEWSAGSGPAGAPPDRAARSLSWKAAAAWLLGYGSIRREHKNEQMPASRSVQGAWCALGSPVQLCSCWSDGWKSLAGCRGLGVRQRAMEAEQFLNRVRYSTARISFACASLLAPIACGQV